MEQVTIISKRVPETRQEPIDPIKYILNEQYVAHLKLMRLLKKFNNGKLEELYGDILDGEYDPVAKHRCRTAFREISEPLG